MNLDIVKYGWMLFKFKENGMEIEGKNLGKITSNDLGNMMVSAERFLHQAKVQLWRERDKELAEIAKRSENATEAQLAFDLAN